MFNFLKFKKSKKKQKEKSISELVCGESSERIADKPKDFTDENIPIIDTQTKHSIQTSSSGPVEDKPEDVIIENNAEELKIQDQSNCFVSSKPIEDDSNGFIDENITEGSNSYSQIFYPSEPMPEVLKVDHFCLAASEMGISYAELQTKYILGLISRNEILYAYERRLNEVGSKKAKAPNHIKQNPNQRKKYRKNNDDKNPNDLSTYCYPIGLWGQEEGERLLDEFEKRMDYYSDYSYDRYEFEQSIIELDNSYWENEENSNELKTTKTIKYNTYKKHENSNYYTDFYERQDTLNQPFNLNYDKGVYYYQLYYPSRMHPYISNDKISMSKDIWDFKNRTFKFTKMYAEILVQAISEISAKTRKSNIGILAVPPSKIWKNSPFDLCIDYIINIWQERSKASIYGYGSKLYSYKNLLVRMKDIPTAHSEGRRAGYCEQYNSLHCKSANLDKYNTAFIILDDVVTTGTSLNVCKDILIQNGADPNDIFLLAIGRTVDENEEEFIY